MVDIKEEKISQEIKKAAYQTRLGHLRRGQEHAAKNEVAKAVQSYLTYLKALETYFGVPEAKLSPKLFDSKKDLTELLLISHVYWDLAKAYDKNPHTSAESRRCLNQFTRFSIGFKYQRVNSDIIRKFIKSKGIRNPDNFKEAYEKMRVSSKGCYIATFCYSENSYEVKQLRAFRNNHIHSCFFRKCCNLYYAISPKLIQFFVRYPKVGDIFSKKIGRPFLRWLIKIITFNEKN